jgi:hypothetical protein
MNKNKIFSKMQYLVLLLVALVAGCASNGAEVDPSALVSVIVTPSTVTIPVTGTQQYTLTAIYANGSTKDVTNSATWTAVNVPAGEADVATIVANSGAATAKAVGTSSIIATYLGKPSTAKLIVNAATATKFEIKPASYAIPVTATQKFTAIETFSDGTSFDRTLVATWTAVNLPLGGTAVATIGPNTGIATGVKIGTSTITATYAASPLSPATATLNVNAATSLSFTITPALASIPVTGTQQYTVIETFSDGSTIDRTAAAVWTATNSPLGGIAVATVSNLAATKGFATGKVVGTATITATLGTQSNSARLDVNAATAVKFEVKPTAFTVPVTGTQQFTAIETFSDGTSFDRTLATIWSAPGLAGAASVATIDLNTGIATGKVKGVTPIIATYAASSLSPATATLTVNDATTTSFKVTPATATIGINAGTQQFNAIETFSDGTTINRTNESFWTAVDIAPGIGVATIVNTGVATGKARGTATIKATFTPVTGNPQSDQAVLTVTAPDPETAGQVVLGAAGTYGIMAHSAMTLSAPAKSHIFGDVGILTTSSFTGFTLSAAAPTASSPTSLYVTGQITSGPTIANGYNTTNYASMVTAFNDLNTAWIQNNRVNKPAPLTPPSGALPKGGTFAAAGQDLTGMLLGPGIYVTNTPTDTLALSNSSGPLVLDAGGNPDAVFIIQANNITTTSGSVVLRNEAKSKNVYWIIDKVATIGDGTTATTFQGTILAGTDITVGLDSNVQGRVLAGAGKVSGVLTINGGTITVP